MSDEYNSTGRTAAMLERLLSIEATDLSLALNEAADGVAQSLEADKVDAFIYEAESHSLVARGTSNTPMAWKQVALGLNRLPIANGGRMVRQYEESEPFLTGHADEDPDELPGIVHALGIRSVMLAPLAISGEIRGLLAVASATPDRYTRDDLSSLVAVARWVGLVAHRAELLEYATRDAAERSRRATAEELMTILAHDLRNLLAPIKGHIDLIHRRAEREHRQADLKSTSQALVSVNRMNRMIAGLLNAAQLDRDVFSLTRELMDLSSTLREVAEEFSSPGSRIEVHAPPELLLIADRERLRQAIENLVSNAVRFSPPGTAVTVGARVEDRNGDMWPVIRVVDRGPGIPRELLPDIFDRYVRGGSSRGLGLGLYVGKRIVEAHGGEVTVETVPGRTCFTILLPPDLLVD